MDQNDKCLVKEIAIFVAATLQMVEGCRELKTVKLVHYVKIKYVAILICSTDHICCFEIINVPFLMSPENASRQGIGIGGGGK